MKLSRGIQICILIIITLVVVSIIWPQNFVTRNIFRAGDFLLNPVKKTAGKGIKGLDTFWRNLKDIRKLAAINANLEKENRRLAAENSRFKEVGNENKILRNQLGFTQTRPEFSLVTAAVIGRDANNFLQIMTIDKGTNDGIKTEMPVISEGFLVGKIVEANVHSSKVFLITNPASIVNAQLQESRATGIVKGELGYGLSIESIAQNAKVAIGDTVITSGLGGTFPKGLILGQVKQVEERQSEVFKKATLRPMVDITALEVVFVITN